MQARCPYSKRWHAQVKDDNPAWEVCPACDLDFPEAWPPPIPIAYSKPVEFQDDRCPITQRLHWKYKELHRRAEICEKCNQVFPTDWEFLDFTDDSPNKTSTTNLPPPREQISSSLSNSSPSSRYATFPALIAPSTNPLRSSTPERSTNHPSSRHSSSSNDSIRGLHNDVHAARMRSIQATQRINNGRIIATSFEVRRFLCKTQILYDIHKDRLSVEKKFSRWKSFVPQVVTQPISIEQVFTDHFTLIERVFKIFNLDEDPAEYKIVADCNPKKKQGSIYSNEIIYSELQPDQPVTLEKLRHSYYATQGKAPPKAFGLETEKSLKTSNSKPWMLFLVSEEEEHVNQFAMDRCVDPDIPDDFFISKTPFTLNDLRKSVQPSSILPRTSSSPRATQPRKRRKQSIPQPRKRRGSPFRIKVEPTETPQRRESPPPATPRSHLPSESNSEPELDLTGSDTEDPFQALEDMGRDHVVQGESSGSALVTAPEADMGTVEAGIDSSRPGRSNKYANLPPPPRTRLASQRLEQVEELE